MSELHPDRPEPAHGPDGEHGGLADLSGLEMSRDAGSSPRGSRVSGKMNEDAVSGGAMRFRVTVDGVSYDVAVEPLDQVSGAVDDPGVGPPKAEAGEGRPPVSIPSGLADGAGFADGRGVVDGGPIVCPVAGAVVKVLVGVGDAVSADQAVAIVEALKVESRVLSPRPGVVSAVLVSAGQRVSAGDVLVRL